MSTQNGTKNGKSRTKEKTIIETVKKYVKYLRKFMKEGKSKMVVVKEMDDIKVGVGVIRTTRGATFPAFVIHMADRDVVISARDFEIVAKVLRQLDEDTLTIISMTLAEARVRRRIEGVVKVKEEEEEEKEEQ